MTADSCGKLLRRHLSTQDIISAFNCFLSITQRAVNGHADRSQLRPAGSVGQIVRHGAHEVFAFGLATVCPLARPVKAPSLEDIRIVQMNGEVRDHSTKQRRLVAFDNQHKIRLLVDDLLSDLNLTAHRINCHQRAFDFQHLQQFRDRRDLVALLIDHDLTQRNVICTGPRADHMDGRFTARAIVTSSQSLAVDGDDLAITDFMQSRNPAQQALLELGRPNRCQHLIEPVVRRNAVRQIHEFGHPLPLQPTELGNCHKIIGSANHRTHRDRYNTQQRVSDLPATWIRQLRKVIAQLHTSL